MALPSITPLGWVAIGGLGLLLWRGLRPQAPVRVVARGPVDVIGSSTAVGLAGPLRAELGPTLGRVTGWGVSGSIAAMWTMQIDAVLLGNPGTVIVSIGTNDSVSPDARARFPARIRIIVDKIRAAGALPVLLSSPAELPHVPEITAALVATGATVIHPPAGLPLQPDRVHPTGAGYQQWARAIARAIL